MVRQVELEAFLSHCLIISVPKARSSLRSFAAISKLTLMVQSEDNKKGAQLALLARVAQLLKRMEKEYGPSLPLTPEDQDRLDTEIHNMNRMRENGIKKDCN